MERSSDHGDLATALAEARPAPPEDFARELDARVAAGFPRRSRRSDSPLSAFANRLHGLAPQRLLLTGGAAALVAIAAATVVIASGDSGSRPTAGTLSLSAPTKSGALRDSGAAPQSASPPSAGSAAEAGFASGPSASAEARTVSPPAYNAPGRPFRPDALARRHREIERSAAIGLLADPADVADDSAAVFAAVHDAHGIVLHSTTTSGRRAGARFDLLIPSARLGDALADFSAIDEVRTRDEATDDITAPTVATGEKLRDSRARIDGLLAQLSAAETEAEMATIEAELARERRQAARLSAQLDDLRRRTDFSRVSLRIESGTSADGGGGWGIDDAFGDAGHILGIAAGVILVGLAVLAPLVLICLLAWLTHRLWLRARRERALDA
jgi:hypothetical protein